MNRLTSEQKAAIQTTDRAVLLVAGAGSGKTTVLVERYLTHLRAGIEPYHILAITFTRDAAKQLHERILKKAKSELPANRYKNLERTPSIGTIHSFCLATLQTYSSPIESIQEEWETQAQIETQIDFWLNHEGQRFLNTVYKSWTLNDVRQTLHYLLKNRFHPSNPTSDFNEFFESFQSFYDFWEKDKIASKKLSFDDLEYFTLKLLKNGVVASEIQKKYRSVLVDEFQDVSPQQWEILKLLCKDDWKKAFLVGDPKQSIYRFRGADIRVFDLARTELLNQGGTLLELTYNFRTQPKVLEKINHVGDFLFKDSAFGYKPMVAANPEGSQGEGYLLRCDMDQEGMSYVQSEMQRLLPMIQKIRQEAPSDSIAILTRVGDKLSYYARELEKNGFEVFLNRSKSLSKSYLVRDLKSFFQALLYPKENLYVASLLRSRFFCLSKETLLFLTPPKREESLLENLKSKNLFPWLVTLCESKEKTLEVALEMLFQNCPYLEEESHEVLSLLQILGKCQSLEEALLTLEKKEGFAIDVSSSPQAIQAMTVHYSKGLEFDHVFLLDGARQTPAYLLPVRIDPDGRWGLRFRKDQLWAVDSTYELLEKEQKEAEFAEKKRILYVAMTRAKKSLYIMLPYKKGEPMLKAWNSWLDSEASETSHQPEDFFEKYEPGLSQN